MKNIKRLLLYALYYIGTMQTQEKKPIATTARLRSIIDYGISLGAKAIHLEPRKGSMAIRYRVSGSLKEERHLSLSEYNALIAQIKMKSNLKITEHSSAQQGFFHHSFKKNAYKIMSAVLPVLDGEKVVLHIQHTNPKPPSLQSLGFWGHSLKNIQQALALHQGLIIVSGKKNTGKSATLFSMLSTLASSGLSVATIEDPVRHIIKGAHQTQVNHKNGLSTEIGLRNILLQDADAILIQPLHLKNISELIETAIQKGHLVFGSLHASDSAEAIHHLINSGLDRYSAAKHIQLAITHEQVRALCNNCKQAYSPTEEEVKTLLHEFSNKEKQAMEQLHILEMAAKESGLAAERKLSTSYETIHQLWKARPSGCQNCHYKGYKGSIGIFEIVRSSTELQKILLANLGRQSLRNEIKRSSTLSLKQDAIIKMLRGLTSMNEITGIQTLQEQD